MPCTRPALEVQYETLAGNFEAEMRCLVDFRELEWNERCLDGHKAERVVRTHSRLQVRQKLFSTSAGHWRNYEVRHEPLL